MTDVTTHSNMSRKVREYFQKLANTQKKQDHQVTDIAAITDGEFAVEKLEAAAKRWHEAYFRQDYPTQDHKDMELDACKYSYDFWKKIVTLKGLGQ